MLEAEKVYVPFLHLPKGENTCPFPWPEVKGVHMGGCVNGTKITRGQAHAHVRGKHQGWMCIKRISDLITDMHGHPSNTMLHEYAHIIDGDDCSVHGESWFRQMQALGAKFTQEQKDYYKKRAPKAWSAVFGVDRGEVSWVKQANGDYKANGGWTIEPVYGWDNISWWPYSRGKKLGEFPTLYAAQQFVAKRRSRNGE